MAAGEVIPIFKTDEREPSVMLLAKYFRMIAVQSNYYNLMPIRLRADYMKEVDVHWLESEYHTKKWLTKGGVYMNFRATPILYPNDALFYAECPRNVRLFDIYRQKTRSVAVVYEPPTWRLHEETLEYRLKKKGRKDWQIQDARDQLQRMKDMVAAMPTLTPSALAQIRHEVLLPTIPPLSAPAPGARAGRAAGTDRRVP